MNNSNPIMRTIQICAACNGSGEYAGEPCECCYSGPVGDHWETLAADQRGDLFRRELDDALTNWKVTQFDEDALEALASYGACCRADAAFTAPPELLAEMPAMLAVFDAAIDLDGIADDLESLEEAAIPTDGSEPDAEEAVLQMVMDLDTVALASWAAGKHGARDADLEEAVRVLTAQAVEQAERLWPACKWAAFIVNQADPLLEQRNPDLWVTTEIFRAILAANKKRLMEEALGIRRR